MRSLNSPDDAFFRRASALRSDGPDGAAFEVVFGGDVAVPSGALYLGPADGVNGVDGVVVRVPADIYRVLVTIRPGTHALPPHVRAITVDLTGGDEASRSGLPANAFWHDSPGVVPVLEPGDGIFIAADAGLRDQHRDGSFPWDGWIRDAVGPALHDAGLAGRNSVELGFPGRTETVVALVFGREVRDAPVEVAMFAGFDERGMPAKLHVTEFHDDPRATFGTPPDAAAGAPAVEPGDRGGRGHIGPPPPNAGHAVPGAVPPWDAAPIGVPPAQGLSIPETPFTPDAARTVDASDTVIGGGTVPALGDDAGRPPFGGSNASSPGAPEAPVFGTNAPGARQAGTPTTGGPASDRSPIGPVFGGAAADMHDPAQGGHARPVSPRDQGGTHGAVGSFFADDDVPSWADPARDEHRPARTFDDVISESAASAWDGSGSADRERLWGDDGRTAGQTDGTTEGRPTEPSVSHDAGAAHPPAGAEPFPSPVRTVPEGPARPGSEERPVAAHQHPTAPEPHVVPATDPSVSGPIIRALEDGLAAADRDDPSSAVPQLGTVLVGLECGALEFPEVAAAFAQRDLTAPQLVDLVVDLQLRAGQAGDAAESLRRALSSAALSGTLAETVHLRKRLGELQLRSGDEATAVSTLEAAENEASTLLRDAGAEERADTVGYARDYHAHITFLLADSSLRLGDPTRAVQLADDSMRAFEQLGLDRMAGRAAFLAATASGRLGNESGRLTSIRDAERVFRRGGELDGLGTALGFLGEDDALRGDYRAAIATFIEARSVLERAGEFANAATAAHNLAICLRQLGDTTGADDATREAERLELRAASERGA